MRVGAARALPAFAHAHAASPLGFAGIKGRRATRRGGAPAAGRLTRAAQARSRDAHVVQPAQARRHDSQKSLEGWCGLAGRSLSPGPTACACPLTASASFRHHRAQRPVAWGRALLCALRRARLSLPQRHRCRAASCTRRCFRSPGFSSPPQIVSRCGLDACVQLSTFACAWHESHTSCL